MNKVLKRCGAIALAVMTVLLPGCKKAAANKEFVNIGGVSYDENEMYYNLYYSIGSSYLSIIEYDETADINKIKSAIDELEKDEQYSDYVKKQKIAFVKQKVCDERLLAVANENGIALSEEELKKVDEEYQSVVDFFNSEDTLTQIKEQFYSDADDADNKSKEYLEKYKSFFLNIYAADNMEQLKEKFKTLALVNKVLEDKANQVPDDEEYVKTYYNQKVEEQKASYSEDPSAFDTDYDYGEIICYYPSGLRYVKHILVKFTDEDQENLLSYETTINELEEKESRSAEEETALQNAKAQMEQLSARMDADAKAKADEAYGKINSGTDFDAVLKEYGEDAGMTDGLSKYAEKGYLIHESSNMVKEFITVAMALKNPGDISKPVKSSYGYHIIKYTEKAREGVVPFEELKDELLTVAMDEKRQEEIVKYYDAAYEEMMASGKVSVNYDVLGFDKETYDRLYQEIMNAMSGN